MKKTWLIVVMICLAFMVTSHSVFAKSNEQIAEELVYGIWREVGVNDWSKYHFSRGNLKILDVKYVDPYGKSAIRINTLDPYGEFYPSNISVMFYITYNASLDKYELRIEKIDQYGRVDMQDSDYNVVFRNSEQ